MKKKDYDNNDASAETEVNQLNHTNENRHAQEEVLSSFSARSSFSVPAQSGLTSAERLRSISEKLYRSFIVLPIGSEVLEFEQF